MTRPILPLILLTLLLSGVALADPSWSEVESTTSWTEHATEQHDEIGEVLILHAVVGGIDCFQAQASTDASSAKLLEVVRDVEGIARFSDAGISEGRILARDGEGLDYFKFVPAPVSSMISGRYRAGEPAIPGHFCPILAQCAQLRARPRTRRSSV